MIYVTESLLYVCFALLMGGLLLRSLPAAVRPEVVVPNKLLIAAAAGIPILSYFPVHSMTVFYAEYFERSYWSLLKDVLLDVKTGKAWTWTVVAALALVIMLSVKSFQADKNTPPIAALLTTALAVIFGWASHSSALYEWSGFFSHTAHFLAVIVWAGILLAVGWFSTNHDNWLAFLRWFSPVAIGCVVVTIVAGIVLMNGLAPKYFDSWLVSYGQGLLIKHILIVPTLVLAFMSSFMIKRTLVREPSTDPRPWVRVESVLLLLIFITTAIMGQQEPPHDVSLILQEEDPAWLYTLFHPEGAADKMIQFGTNVWGILTGVIAVGLLVGMLAYPKRRGPAVPALLGLLFAASAYVSIMLSVY